MDLQKNTLRFRVNNSKNKNLQTLTLTLNILFIFTISIHFSLMTFPRGIHIAAHVTCTSGTLSGKP